MNENDEIFEVEADTVHTSWAGATVMVTFFVMIIVICGICTWGFVELAGRN